jgi:hypothetical protein
MDSQKLQSKNQVNSPAPKSRNISAPSSPFLQSSRPGTINTLSSSQKRLEDARVIQRTLVYIINLPSSMSDESIISSPLCFGKYGKIVKIHISPGHYNSQDLTFGAYLTFSTEEEAAVCIRACHDFVLDGKRLTATFGTTKYCSYFLKNSRCQKSECVFLHFLASNADTIFREDMINTRHIQPQDSIFDRLKVHIMPPIPPSKLPEFNIARERAISEIVEANYNPPQRPRIYSRDNCSTSRYHFIMDCDEKPVEIPGCISRLKFLANSPCKDTQIIPTRDIEEIIDPDSPLKWFKDVMEVKHETGAKSSVIVTKKHRSSL